MCAHEPAPGWDRPIHDPVTGSDFPFPLWQVLDPRCQALPLLGREQELAALWRWLKSARPVAVQTLVSRAGTGKTRLATEFVAQVAALEPGVWEAGFVDGAGWPPLPPVPALSEPLWRRPTLLVVDDAAMEVQPLRLFLRAALRQSPEARLPLRVLLLTRQASPNEGWLRYLQEEAGTLFDPPWPAQLPELAGHPVRRQLWEEGWRSVAGIRSMPTGTTEATGAGLPCDDGPPEATGADVAKLLMAAVLAARTGAAPPASLQRSRKDLAFALADLELDRLGRFAAAADPGGRQWMTHVTACATVLGGLPPDALAALAEDERRAMHWECPGGAPVLAECLSRALPDHGGGLRVAHDLVGGALVLRVFGRPSLGEAGRRVLERLARRRPWAVATFLARLAANFAGLHHPEALEWLGLILDAREEPSVGWLLEADRGLPIGTPGMRALTTQVSGRLIDALQRVVPGAGSRALAAELARLLGCLSWRLSDSGRRDAALEKAQQAEAICLELAKAQPVEHGTDWAAALGVLAYRLSDLGFGDAAVAKARQAEAINAALAAQTGPPLVPEPRGENRTRRSRIGRQEDGDNTPTNASGEIALARETAPLSARARWADSLQVSATVLERSLRFEEARQKAENAAEVYRQLAVDHPEDFLPDLAAAQSRRAVLLGASGRAAEGLEMMRESEQTCRSCTPCCPDGTWAVRATSLGILAGHCERSGFRDESLTCADQAVAAWRALGQRQPAAFLPDLGRALRRLAAGLSELNRGEEALTHFAEAERIFTRLARLDPGSFLTDLAVTRLGHAHTLGMAGDWTTALGTAKEAETILRSMSEARPEVFLPLWAEALAVEGECYRSLPHLTDEIERYGRAVIACCARTHTRSTLAGAVPEATPECAG